MANSNPGPSVTTANQTGIGYTNNLFDVMIGTTLSPAIVAANTTAEQTFTVTGLQVGDIITAYKPTAQAGLSLVGARVSAANTLALTFGNNTGAGITPTASEIYALNVIRLLPQYVGNLPTTLPLI
ncbi:MAG TPA: hypothetical protein VIN03_16685 [Roseateles sp.]